MFYVMSDLHGCYNEFKKALDHWDRKNETLVILGDLIDRGPDSLKVVQTLMHLKETYSDRVIVLQGNHDESFAKWLLDTHPDDFGFYYMPMHNETIQSFFGHKPEDIKNYKKSTRTQRCQHIRYLYAKELRFLYNLPKYYETDHCIFVHAGINLERGEDWRFDMRSMNHIRDPFIYSEIKAPAKVFFGHTTTNEIRNESENYDIWQSALGDKIGIDGAISMGGQLNAIKVDEFGNITETIVIEPCVPVT